MLDASVALAWVLPDQDPAVAHYADAVLQALRLGDDEAIVPEIWHAEVAGVLLRHQRARTLSGEDFRRALGLFESMQLETHHQPYRLGALVERALRYRLQAIDALYLELAVERALPLATPRAS